MVVILITASFHFRGSAIVEHAKHKMASMLQKLDQLEEQEKQIKQKIHQNNEHKKLTVF